MDPGRIAELLQPFLHSPLGPSHPEGRKNEEPGVLSAAQLESISTYINMLLRWNSRINLTAIRDPEEIVPRHFGESLYAARHLFRTGRSPEEREGASVEREPGRAVGPLAPGAVRVADLGSGAGFPGIPIKLWAPGIGLTLIESNHKKATFLREITRALTLTSVNIQTLRAEILTGAAFDVVTLRAVERFESILPTAVSLLARRGRLALLIGSAQLTQAQTTLANLAGQFEAPPTWSVPMPIPLSRSRILAVVSLSKPVGDDVPK